MDDVTAVTQLILLERQGRDRGWWQQMRECIHPEAELNMSWFRGSGADFVTRSQVMSGSGTRSVHRLSPPVIHLDGGRALAEMSAGIEMRVDVDGVEADLTSYARFVYRTEITSGRWWIVGMDPVYERDTLQATAPDASLPLDAGELAAFRPSYRFLSYVLTRRGFAIADDLCGDDRPEAVAAFYGEVFTWLNR